jgi:hypothetical protein
MLAMLMIGAFTAGGFLFGADSVGVSPVHYESVFVEQGDTLWQIASEHKPESMRIRIYIRELCEINGIDAGSLRAGTTIRVPVYG